MLTGAAKPRYHKAMSAHAPCELTCSVVYCCLQVLLGDSNSPEQTVADLIDKVKQEFASNKIELDASQDIQLLQVYLQKDDPDIINQDAKVLTNLSPIPCCVQALLIHTEIRGSSST